MYNAYERPVCIIPVIVASIQGTCIIMGMAPIFRVTAITMDTAHMYQAMVTIMNTEWFIGRNLGIMGSAHGSLFMR